MASEDMHSPVIESQEHGDLLASKVFLCADLAPLDLEALVPQLSRLWDEAKNEPDSQTNKESLNAIADAEASAKKGDENGTLVHLKKAGTWAYNIAERLTIAVAAKAIEKAMGIP